MKQPVVMSDIVSSLASLSGRSVRQSSNLTFAPKYKMGGLARASHNENRGRGSRAGTEVPELEKLEVDSDWREWVGVWMLWDLGGNVNNPEILHLEGRRSMSKLASNCDQMKKRNTEIFCNTTLPVTSYKKWILGRRHHTVFFGPSVDGPKNWQTSFSLQETPWGRFL